jgi:oxygen-independent coproporphyrinogen-3 oxidase
MGTHLQADPIAHARDQARLGLYVHVPFCARRCAYCDFSTGTISAAAQERYLAAIEIEARLRAPTAAGRTFTSVFFGGGTPSALGSSAFRRLWQSVSSAFDIARDAEITLEANPESVRPSLLETWATAGVNRLSMGAQSFHADELERLGRIHPAGRPGEAVALARAAGFRRLSLDLMFGFPGNDVGRFAASLEQALALPIEHLSAYCFIPESGTPLGDAVTRGEAALPGPDEQADLYAHLVARIEAGGWSCYETSNFCAPGAECRHNLVYWLRRPYVALGPSAHGFLDGVRYGNHYALARWAEELERGRLPEAEHEPETEIAIAQEVMMLGLRLAGGLRARDYSRRAWQVTRARYREAFAAARACGRLEARDGAFRIPEALGFVADDVIAWIEARADALEFDSSARRFIPSASCPNPPSQVASPPTTPI